ncbi:Hsp70 family protein [Micromonospora sp. NBC_01796]|uniref:Hsp70 family protein n=1 Tax=Micromonospora sp. NBC_01796 TaxID=2975987 RepID=UPI002DD79EC6|nr:Hsp70 family protein [Micromonospora sp. NBC_01796]WSA88919.1 Hsp70 family protein [Micromonospora sp. NBC_01796]
MAGQDGGYALGVDLGTSNTVAVLRWPDGRTRPLLFDGQPVMPSGVFLDGAGLLHVGRDAQRLAQADPGRYDPNPKRRIDEPGVLLGDAEVATVDLLGGLLRAVAQAAVEAVGFLPPAVLTYPASWGARRRGALATAVARAGWPPVRAVDGGAGAGGGGTLLVAEPVAAARYFADVLRRPVPVGAAIGVFDFGGGTLDIAVVRNEGLDQFGRARFVVVGSGGLPELGGLDLDAALVEHLGRLVGATQPEVWRQLAQPESTTGWRNRRQFWDDVRGAKEMLSRTTVAPIAVPGVEQAVHLTRDELERLATPLLRPAVFEAASVIGHSGLRPDQLAGLFLVGGSSRVPLVARLLHAELGVAPTVLEQPELPVAEGALAELSVNAIGTPEPTSITVGAAGAVSGAAPAGAVAGSSASDPTVVGSVVPVSEAGAGGSGAAGAGRTAYAGGDPRAGGSAYAGGVGRVPWLRGRRAVLIGAGAVLALAGVVTAAVLYFTRDGYADIAFEPFRDIGEGIPLGEERPFYTYTALSGDRAYVAYEREDKRLRVIAAEAGTGTRAWQVTTEVSSDRWDGITALPDGLVLLTDEASATQSRELVVLDPADGGQMWRRTINGDDSVLYFDRTLVLVDRVSGQVIGLDLGTGKARWDEPSPKDTYGKAPTSVYPVTVPEDLGGAASLAGVQAPVGGKEPRIVQIGADRSARVMDVNTGKVLRTAKGAADYTDLVVAHDGRLYIAPKDGAYRVTAYDLERMGEPTSLYTADPQHYPDRLVACGRDRVCLLDRENFDIETTELLSIPAKGDGAEEAELWRKPAAKADELLPVGDHVAVGSGTLDTTTVYGPDGTQVISKEGIAVRVDGGNLLLFADEPSSASTDVSVAGVRVSSNQPVELGELKGVRPSACSWNSSVIVCPGESDLRFRTFVKN